MGRTGLMDAFTSYLASISPKLANELQLQKFKL